MQVHSTLFLTFIFSFLVSALPASPNGDPTGYKRTTVEPNDCLWTCDTAIGCYNKCTQAADEPAIRRPAKRGLESTVSERDDCEPGVAWPPHCSE